MKKYLALLLIALMAASIVSAAGVVSAHKGRAVTRTLDTPQLLEPQNGKVFAAGEQVTLSWTPVKHATDYQLLLILHAPDGSSWGQMTDAGAATSYTIGTAGGSGWVYEWSVQAQNTDTSGAWARATSAWSETRSLTL